MVIFWITFQNISIFLWISILPEPTVPLFFRRLETSRNTSYNLPAIILTKMISSYLYIHIRPRRIHLQHQCLVQDFLSYGSMSDVGNCWKIISRKRKGHYHRDKVQSCYVSIILVCTRIDWSQACSWATRHL